VIDIRPSCPVCGTVMADAELHQKFHDGLREIARRVEAPDMTPEEYEQAIREEWERRSGGVPGAA
jgi:hypothetical protein